MDVLEDAERRQRLQQPEIERRAANAAAGQREAETILGGLGDPGLSARAEFHRGGARTCVGGGLLAWCTIDLARLFPHERVKRQYLILGIEDAHDVFESALLGMAALFAHQWVPFRQQ